MDNNKPCLRCVIKHMLNAKTYMMESIQFGAKLSVRTEDLDNIIIRLAKYVLAKKGDNNVGK